MPAPMTIPTVMPMTSAGRNSRRGVDAAGTTRVAYGSVGPRPLLRLDATEARDGEYLIGFGDVTGHVSLSDGGDPLQQALRHESVDGVPHGHPRHADQPRQPHRSAAADEDAALALGQREIGGGLGNADVRRASELQPAPDHRPLGRVVSTPSAGTAPNPDAWARKRN